MLRFRIHNIVKYIRKIEDLTEEATFDKLTGFLNKSHGSERIAKLCARKTGSLMIIDIDSFKLVNDLFGHEMGDEFLRGFADIVRNNTRETDTISRIGGDEFLAFYEDVTDEMAVASIAYRLNRQASEEAVRLMGEDHGIPLGISIGVVMVPEQGRDYEKLFALADRALYSVKRNGRHGYHIYSLSTDGYTDETNLEQRLEYIIEAAEERNKAAGALELGGDAFSLVFRFIMRFYKRYGGAAALLLFTLTIDDNDGWKLMEISSQFSKIIRKVLRVSDIIMQNGPGSFLILLTECTKAGAEEAANRIKAEWEKHTHRDAIVVDHALNYIDFEESGIRY